MDTRHPRRSCSGWAMLDGFPRRIPNGDDDHDDEGLSATMAEGYTSGGERVRFALKASPPPRISRIYYDWQWREEQPCIIGSMRLRRLGGDGRRAPKVVAAHRSCILLSLAFPTTTKTKGGGIASRFMQCTEDYFVYQAHGSGGTTLARLPPCPHGPALRRSEMGILCRDADDSSVVAHLAGLPSDFAGSKVCLVCIFKQGSASWEEKTLPVVAALQEQQQVPSCWVTDLVLPCGSDSLCFVDYLRGLLFFTPESDTLRYVPLPVDPCDGDAPPGAGCRGALGVYRSVCTASNGGVIKFVEVAYPKLWYPTSMELALAPSPSSPFAVYSWILKPQYPDSEWVLEASISAETFWAITDKMELPRCGPEFPLVDMQDPSVIYFVLRELGGGGGPALKDTSMLGIHMPSKTAHCLSPVHSALPQVFSLPCCSSSSGCGCSSSSGTSSAYRDTDTSSRNLASFEAFVCSEISMYLEV